MRGLDRPGMAGDTVVLRTPSRCWTYGVKTSFLVKAVSYVSSEGKAEKGGLRR